MSNEIVKQQSAPVEVFNFFNQEQFQTMQRVCTLFANSELVPDMYKITPANPKEKAIANCMIALEIAQRIGASPLMVMQNLYIVYGRPGWSAKFLVATVNTCGRFDAIQYRTELKGKIKLGNEELENWECIAFTKAKGSEEVLESTPVTIKMAIDEGWYGKKGSKWPNMPKKMLRYRAATFWTNEYAPEVSMGMRTADELEDYLPYEDVTDKVKTEVADKANKTVIAMPDEETPKDKAIKSEMAKEEKSTEVVQEGPGY
jgi:hypothetical protein